MNERSMDQRRLVDLLRAEAITAAVDGALEILEIKGQL